MFSSLLGFGSVSSKERKQRTEVTSHNELVAATKTSSLYRERGKGIFFFFLNIIFVYNIRKLMHVICKDISLFLLVKYFYFLISYIFVI